MQIQTTQPSPEVARALQVLKSLAGGDDRHSLVATAAYYALRAGVVPPYPPIRSTPETVTINDARAALEAARETASSADEAQRATRALHDLQEVT